MPHLIHPACLLVRQYNKPGFLINVVKFVENIKKAA